VAVKRKLLVPSLNLSNTTNWP